MTDDVERRIERCERLTRRLRVLIGFNLAALAGAAIISLGAFARGEVTSVSADTLRVRQLVVTDTNGVVRVRIGAHLPDAVIAGRRMPRGEDASGVMLYDDVGQERGGYVTFAPSRNVALTLDTRRGQVALFAADSADGAAARLWQGGNWVDMRASSEGSRFTAGEKGTILVQQPAMTAGQLDAECADLKTELRQLKTPPPMQQVLAACSTHMPASACRRCLGVKK